MCNHLISATYTVDLRTPMRKAVMVLLADKASYDGSGIWASKQTMADELCCSRQTVVNTIAALIRDGLVHEDGKNMLGNGLYTVNYRIDIDALHTLPLVPYHARKAAERAAKRGATSLGGNVIGGYDVDAGDTPRGHKPPLNHTAKAVRGTRLPDDWEPAPLTGDLARISAGDVAIQLTRMRDWAASAPGSKAVKRDWDATFRNWLRRAVDEGRIKLGPQSAECLADPVDRRRHLERTIAVYRRLGRDTEADEMERELTA